MRASPYPCRPDCERRRWDCHMEGNCPEHDAARAKIQAEREADKNRVQGIRDAYYVAHQCYLKTMRAAHDRKGKRP